MWDHPAALVSGKCDVIAAWLVRLIVAATCFVLPMLAAALGPSATEIHIADAGCKPAL
jgi:hypothetical protein